MLPVTTNHESLSTHLLQLLNLGHQLFRLSLKLRPLRIEILFRIFARLELEVQVAQILVELFLALHRKSSRVFSRWLANTFSGQKV